MINNTSFLLLLAILFIVLCFKSIFNEINNIDYSIQNTITVQRKNYTVIKDAKITYYVKTGYKMACGKYPTIGMVATSDRNIPFGTKVKISGKIYEVCDRTAKWINKNTFDIFTDKTKKEALSMGTYKTDVIIYN